MSAPPPPPQPPSGGEGLGHSTPLVTVGGGPPGLQQHGTAAPSPPPPPPQYQQQQQQQSFTPATGNHPLAGPPMPPPPQASPAPPPPPVPQRIAPGGVPVFQSPGAAQAVEVALSTPPIPQNRQQMATMTTPPPPQQTLQQYQQNQQQQQPHQQPFQQQQQQQQPPPYMASPPPQQQQQQQQPSVPQPTTTVANFNSPTKAGSPAQSLDDLVDAFLSGPSYRTEQGIQPLLRPPPLINENPLQCLRTLVERRAWGDVLQVTADLLRGDSNHAQIYQTMLVNSPTSGSAVLAMTQQPQDRDETVEIVALQCHAWLKLRRYTDLGQEIERWNFLPFNDQYNANKAPKWVPWSLRTYMLLLVFCYSCDGCDMLYVIDIILVY